MKVKTFPAILVLCIYVLYSGIAVSCTGSPDTPVKESLSNKEKPGPDTADEEVKADESGTEPSSSDSPAKAPEETTVTNELKGAESGLPESDDIFFDTGDYEEREYAIPEKMSAGVREYSGAAPSESGLKAGYADDNRQFTYFIDFLREHSAVSHIPADISERIEIRMTDISGKSIPNAEVNVFSSGRKLANGKTTADGIYRFYPSLAGPEFRSFNVTAEDPVTGKTAESEFRRNGRRSIDLVINENRRIAEPVPMDILFILDTTGSMGEEIQRLKATIQLIHLNLSSISVKTDLRFGMVLYKDREDEDYRTRTIPLTADLDKFQKELDAVDAFGGGDTPEDLQAALEQSMRNIEWNPSGIRLAFIITDAPPHLDYGQDFTYMDAAKTAAEKGIRIHSVGTGGLPLNGEYILRQISQLSSGRYIFLTYGETGESEGGTPGSVSHHTGGNFQTDKLESIIIRFAREDLGYLTDNIPEEDDSYFEASKISGEEREETLDKLFTMALEQLRDYSSLMTGDKTTAAVMPFLYSPDDLKLDSEYLAERLVFSAEKASIFRMVERKNIQKILDEQKLQLSGITEGEGAAELGRILNAEALITGTLFEKPENYELYLKLVRVETGEILSVTRALIDKKLGISR